MGNLLSLNLDEQQEIRLKMIARIPLASIHIAFEKYLVQFGYQNVLITFREFSRLFSHAFKRDELQHLFTLFVCDIKENGTIYDEYGEEIEVNDKISIFEVLGTCLFLCDLKDVNIGRRIMEVLKLFSFGNVTTEIKNIDKNLLVFTFECIYIGVNKLLVENPTMSTRSIIEIVDSVLGTGKASNGDVIKYNEIMINDLIVKLTADIQTTKIIFKKYLNVVDLQSLVSNFTAGFAKFNVLAAIRSNMKLSEIYKSVKHDALQQVAFKRSLYAFETVLRVASYSEVRENVLYKNNFFNVLYLYSDTTQSDDVKELTQRVAKHHKVSDAIYITKTDFVHYICNKGKILAPNKVKLKEFLQEIKGVESRNLLLNYVDVNILVRRYAKEMLLFTNTDAVIDEFVSSFIQHLIDACDVDKMGVVDIDAILQNIDEFDHNMRQLDLYKMRLMNAE
jgi:hypothetical protein